MLNYYARGAGLDLGPAFQPRHPRCQPTQKLRASCALVPSVHSALTVKQFLAMAILAGPLQHWLWGFLQALYLLGQLVGLPVPGAAANLWHSLQGLAVVPSLPHWVMAFTTMEALTPQPVFQSPTTVARHRWHWAQLVFATLQFFSPSCDAFFVLWFSIALHLTLSTSMSNRYLVDFGYFHIWCLRIDFEWCFRIDREHILTGM